MRQHLVSYVVFTLGLTALATARAEAGTMDAIVDARDPSHGRHVAASIVDEPPGTRPTVAHGTLVLPGGPTGPLAVPGPTPLTSP